MTRVCMTAVCCAVIVGVTPAVAQEGPSPAPARLAAARATFDKYVQLERTFDPAMADIYSSDAVIKNRRTYPTGEVREITLPAPQYKQLIRQAIPLAKAKGDTNRYSECRYNAEGERVRIRCTRFAELKKYSSPFSLLVGAGPAGEWLVFEELSESQP